MLVRTTLALTAALMTLGAVATTAFAQESQTDKEMQSLKSYCKPDIERLCAQVEPGGGRLKQCLKQHKEQVSVGCAKALSSAKK